MDIGEQLGYMSIGTGNKHLVLIHGLASDSGFWLPLVSRIDKDEFSIHLVDLRGHGKSTFRHRSLLPSLLAEDIERVCHSKKIIEPLFVCHSFGGRVGLQIMQRKRDEDMCQLLLLDTYWPEFQERPSIKDVIGRSSEEVRGTGLSDDDIPVSASKSLELMRHKSSRKAGYVRKKRREENVAAWEEIMKNERATKRIDREVDQKVKLDSIKNVRDDIQMVYGSASIFIDSGIRARDSLGINCEVLENARHFFPREQAQFVADRIIGIKR